MNPVVCRIVFLLFHQFLLWKYQIKAECEVASFRVQENLDFTRYVGKWYEQKWLPQSYIPPDQLFQDYTHHYVLNHNSSATVFISGRSPENLSVCFHYVALLEQTTVPGKLRYTRYFNQSHSDVIDYWVVSTDYEHYAFIYGCEKQNPQGRCTYQNSWVWSRTPILPASYWTLVNNSIQAVCVNYSRYLDTQQTNECTVDCFVQSFQVQPNFNLNMYLGKWYEQKWLPQSYINPNELFQDYTHNNVISNNGSVTAYVNGRDPVDLKQCFSYTMLLETTNTPGKLRRTAYVNATTSMVSDYWVMKTDYTGYAVVYGCRQRNAWGQCIHTDSWVWSRTPQLKVDQWAIINTTLENLCLPEANFVATQQTNECKVKVTSSGPVLMPSTPIFVLAFLTSGFVESMF